MSTVRRAYSRDDLREATKKYMVTMFGKPAEAEDREAWYYRLGLLYDFVETMWHEIPPSEDQRPTDPIAVIESIGSALQPEGKPT